MFSGLTVGITKQTSATSAVYPPSLPTTPVIFVPISFAYLRASTKLGLILLTRFPPPTEKIKRASLGWRWLVWKPLYKDSGPPFIISSSS